jgi:hypothetical protein
MAKVEFFNGSNILNVEQRVGLNKPNLWGDILIVQALLKYIREGKGGENGFNFLPADRSPLPNPDGNFRHGQKHSLDKLILAYQQSTNRNFVNSPFVGKKRLTEDGVISRAKGFANLGGGKKFTIEDLNDTARVICLSRGRDGDHIADIQKTFPQVNAVIFGFALPF